MAEVLQRAVGQLHREVAMLQALQQLERRAGGSRGASGQGQGGAGGGGGVHGGVLVRHGIQRVTMDAGASGLRWKRTRLSHSCSACQ
ncbi:hypothetical protein D3C72_2102940 [compost metagenome]